VRLFTGGLAEFAGDTQRAVGIEISLEPGWKTYWRSPGEGIAPSFSWDESSNLKAAKVLWPAPTRFSDGESTSIGYKERVVLPVLITPEDPAKPVSLSLAMAYGICKDICMPVEAELSLDLDAPVRKTDREEMIRVLSSVPRKQGPDISCPHRFLSAKLVRLGEKPALRVETSFDGDALERDLMTEAPEEIHLASPTLDPKSGPGRAAYLLPADPESAPALQGTTITVTTVAKQGSCETTTRVE